VVEWWWRRFRPARFIRGQLRLSVSYCIIGMSCLLLHLTWLPRLNTACGPTTVHRAMYTNAAMPAWVRHCRWRQPLRLAASHSCQQSRISTDSSRCPAADHLCDTEKPSNQTQSSSSPPCRMLHNVGRRDGLCGVQDIVRHQLDIRHTWFPWIIDGDVEWLFVSKYP
jgi:hypothetical protein